MLLVAADTPPPTATVAVAGSVEAADSGGQRHAPDTAPEAPSPTPKPRRGDEHRKPGEGATTPDAAGVVDESAADGVPAGPVKAGSSTMPDDPVGVAETIADTTGFDWRLAGGTFTVGCHPAVPRCPWGMYEPSTRTIWLSPEAYTTRARLTYVVLHELAHLWQWTTPGPAVRSADITADVTAGAGSRMEQLEKAADCLAAVWGADPAEATYWQCPETDLARIADIFTTTGPDGTGRADRGIDPTVPARRQ